MIIFITWETLLSQPRLRLKNSPMTCTHPCAHLLPHFPTCFLQQLNTLDSVFFILLLFPLFVCFAPYVCTSTNILFDFACYFTSAGKIHPSCLMWLALVYFHGGVVVHCVGMTHLPTILSKDSGLFSMSSWKVLHVRLHAQVLKILLGIHLEVELQICKYWNRHDNALFCYFPTGNTEEIPMTIFFH